MIVSNDVITSRQNPTVQFAASLKEKKYRDQSSSFFAEGEKLFLEAADACLPISCVLICEERRERIFPLVEKALKGEEYANVRVFFLSLSAFEKISTEKSPQGIITIIKYLDFFKKCIKINKETVAAFGRGIGLCSLRDPGNLGAVIRSAVGFGAESLLLTEDCADLYHPKTVRAAMGTLFRVRAFLVEDMAEAVEDLRREGRRVFAAELRDGAQALGDCPLRKEDVFLIGNEGHGIPEEVSSVCDGSVYIPISPGVESLNAAVAAAVLLWEQSKK